MKKKFKKYSSLFNWNFVFLNIFTITAIAKGGMVWEYNNLQQIVITTQGSLKGYVIKVTGVPNPSENALLILFEDDIVAYVENDKTLYILGDFLEKIASLSFPNTGLIIENASGEQVAELLPEGDLLIKGRSKKLVEAVTYTGSNVFEYNETLDKHEFSYKNITTPDGVEGKVDNAGNIYYYVKDHLGSVREVINEEGDLVEAKSYHSYGNIINEMSSSEYSRESFNGKELDNDGKGYNTDGIGLYYFGARYFDANIGIWTSTDPRHEYWSPYAYPTNPIITVDENGEAEAEIAVLVVIVLYLLWLVGVNAVNYFQNVYWLSQYGCDDPWSEAWRQTEFGIYFQSNVLESISEWAEDHFSESKEEEKDPLYNRRFDVEKENEEKEEPVELECPIYLFFEKPEDFEGLDYSNINFGLIIGYEEPISAKQAKLKKTAGLVWNRIQDFGTIISQLEEGDFLKHIDINMLCNWAAEYGITECTAFLYTIEPTGTGYVSFRVPKRIYRIIEKVSYTNAPLAFDQTQYVIWPNKHAGIYIMDIIYHLEEGEPKMEDFRSLEERYKEDGPPRYYPVDIE